jgi:predicted transcriptional regulator
MELYEAVRRSHRAAPLTVITVANRLVSKRLLRRERRDELFRYSPVYDRDAFTALVSRRVVEGILSVGGDAIAASFVDVLAERDPDQLAELARLIRRRLREQEGK